MKTTPVVLIQDIVTSNAGAWLGNATLMNFWYDEKSEKKNKNEVKFKSDKCGEPRNQVPEDVLLLYEAMRLHPIIKK